MKNTRLSLASFGRTQFTRVGMFLGLLYSGKKWLHTEIIWIKRKIAHRAPSEKRTIASIWQSNTRPSQPFHITWFSPLRVVHGWPWKEDEKWLDVENNEDNKISKWCWMLHLKATWQTRPKIKATSPRVEVYNGSHWWVDWSRDWKQVRHAATTKWRY